MSMITELFGDIVLTATVEEIKVLINGLPHTQEERRSYLLHDWASIRGITLTASDFLDVEQYNKDK